MILGTIENASLYTVLNPGFSKAFAFLKEAMICAPEPGRHGIDGDTVYANVMNSTTSPAESLGWEAHRQYIDIQFLLDGEERIGYAHISDLTDVGEYSEEKDCLLAPDAEHVTDLLLRRGVFAILFPEDAHRPGGMEGSPSAVRKIVVKVRV